MERIRAGKIFSAWQTVATHADSFELDLLSSFRTSLMDYFALPCRTQIAIVDGLMKKHSSYLYASVNEYDFLWGNLEELASQQLELFVAANTGEKNRKPFASPRPFNNQPKALERTAEEQAQIDAMLPQLPGFN